MCKRELTEFLAELTEFAAELSEFSLPKQYSRNSNPPVSYFRGGTNRVLVNSVFVPCQKGAVLTETAKMANLQSTH